MPVKVPTPTQAQVEELRKRFVQKYDKTPPAVPFHPNDIDRVKNADLWLIRYLEMYDLDLDVAIENLWNTCIWRQENGINELNENNVNRDILMRGVVFARNKDVDGKPLLIFKTKHHSKGSHDMDEIMRVVVYWIERIHRETNMSQMSIFFDMDGTGLGNMDIDFVKRTTETFKLYYPNCLNYILVFELAWVLNAVFKVVKGILPAKALEILKMITKKDINTYIDKDNCLKSWGGNDNYTFAFVPESKTKTETLKVNGTATSQVSLVLDTTKSTKTMLNGGDAEDHNNNISGSPDKKVHFANSSPVRWPKDTEAEAYHTSQDHNMLRITPNEFLTFSQGENSDAVIDITCISKTPVMYKIQTTSPEKFRVRPRCGVLKSNQTVSVNILLKAEHRLGEASKDKFLLMCLPAPDDLDMSTPQHVAEVWKQMQMDNTVDMEQYRLCCVYKNSEQITRNGYGGGGGGGSGVGQGPLGDLADSLNDHKSAGHITELAKHAKKLEKQLRFTQILQYLTLFLLLVMSVAVVYLLRLEMDSGSLQSSAGGGSTKVPTASPNIPTSSNFKQSFRARIPKTVQKITRFGKAHK